MSEWEQTTLGAVARIAIGKTPPRKDPNYWTDDLTFPFCTIADMDGRWVEPQREGVTQAAIDEGKAKRFPAGSLMMSFKLSIGRIGFAARDLYPNEAIARLESVRPDLDERYLAVALEGQDLTTGAGRAVKGKTLNHQSIRAIPILLPPSYEQRRIIAVMEAVDTQIEALTQELTAATACLDRARDEVPVSDEVSISSVLEGLDSGKSIRTAGDPPVNGVPRVLKLSAVQLGTFNADEAKRLDDQTGYMQIHRVQEGDLLITRSNTPERVGYVAVASAVPTDTYMPDLMWRIRPDGSRCLPLYLSHLLSSPSIRARITATASGTNTSMQKINKKSFGMISIPVPNAIAEQQEYIEKCEALVTITRELAIELQHVRAARSALLTSLLYREIEIPESYDRLLEEES